MADLDSRVTHCFVFKVLEAVKLALPAESCLKEVTADFERGKSQSQNDYCPSTKYLVNT